MTGTLRKWFPLIDAPLEDASDVSASAGVFCGDSTEPRFNVGIGEVDAHHLDDVTGIYVFRCGQCRRRRAH